MNDTNRPSPFLYAWLLDGKGGGQKLDLQAAGEATMDQGLVWMHLDIREPIALEWLFEHSGLDPLIADMLGADETRPRVVAHDNGLLFVLRGVNLNPGADPDDMVSVRIWLEPGRIVSIRRRQVFAIGDVSDAIARGNGPSTSGEFLVHVVEYLGDRISDVIDDIEDKIDSLEGVLSTNIASTSISAFSALRRQAASMRRYLAPQRDALDRLYRDQGTVLTAAENRLLREQADRMTRLLEDLELVRERATVLQEEYMSRLAHEQNARVYVLSVVAVIFLPLSFLTGLLGMNVAGLPGTENPAAFTISAIVMIAVGIAVVVFFRWKKWI